MPLNDPINSLTEDAQRIFTAITGMTGQLNAMKVAEALDALHKDINNIYAEIDRLRLPDVTPDDV